MLIPNLQSVSQNSLGNMVNFIVKLSALLKLFATSKV